MSEFRPRVFEIALSIDAVPAVFEYMELTGVSYSQVCKNGIQRAVAEQNESTEIQIPTTWLEEEKSGRTRTSMRLPTEVLMSLDTLATSSNVSWSDMASFLTECEVYYSLALLKEPLD